MRKHLLAASVAVVGFLAVSSTSLSAQMASRKGLYVSVGGGVGQSTTSVTENDEESFTQRFGGLGAAWTANVGWGFNDKWAFGLQYDYQKTGCTDCEGEAHFTNSFISATGTYYPSTANNFFIKLNLGYGMNEFTESESPNAKANGFAGGIGFGYDWMIGKGGFIVKPYAQYISMVSTSTYSTDGDFGGDKARGEILQFGIALGYKH